MRGASAGSLRSWRSLRLCVRHFADLADLARGSSARENAAGGKPRGGENPEAQPVASRMVRSPAEEHRIPMGERVPPGSAETLGFPSWAHGFRAREGAAEGKPDP